MDFADFDAAMPLVDRMECRSGLDSLQLRRVADQHDFRMASAAWDSTRSIWPVPTLSASSMTGTSREVSNSRRWPLFFGVTSQVEVLGSAIGPDDPITVELYATPWEMTGVFHELPTGLTQKTSTRGILLAELRRIYGLH